MNDTTEEIAEVVLMGVPQVMLGGPRSLVGIFAILLSTLPLTPRKALVRQPARDQDNPRSREHFGKADPLWIKGEHHWISP